MAMDLKSFFDLDKVVFTELELELPYETFAFSKVNQGDFSYSSISSISPYLYTSSDLSNRVGDVGEVIINYEEELLSGVAA